MAGMEGMEGGWDPADALRAMEMESRVHDTSESEAELSERLMKENLPLVTANLIHTALYSDNEKLRFDAGRYLMERALGKTSDQGFTSAIGDPLDRFFKDLEKHTAGAARDEA
jgi:hypothetical protein